MRKANLFFLASALFFVNCKKTDGTGSPNDKPVGASANDLLSQKTYKSLKVEIQYMTGFAPDAAAITQLQNFLNTYLDKPGGINIQTKEIDASSNTVLSVSDIASIEKSKRTSFNSGDQAAVYILYTNGHYSNSNVLGVAYKNTSAVVFGKTIHDNSGAIGQVSRTKLESTVLQHEIGHLLGLVDIGSPMQTFHKDVNHGNHCTATDCLMYYASETTDVLGFLLTGSVPSLDANCVNDLKANGGK